MSRAGLRNVGVLVTLYASIRNSSDCPFVIAGHLRDAEIDAPLIGTDDGIPSEIAELGPGALEGARDSDSCRDGTSPIRPSSGPRASCRARDSAADWSVETRTALNSPSVTVNGRPDWKVPMPAICQPSTKRLPSEGQVPRPAQNQPVLAVKVRQRLVQLGPRLIVFDLEQSLVREVVDGA